MTIEEERRRQEEEALKEIELLLAQNRPKHLAEGCRAGIGHAAAGAVRAGGIAALSPWVAGRVGYRRAGAAGAVAAGAAGGLLGAGHALTVAGAAGLAAAAQVLRGAANTPMALTEPALAGRWWNERLGEWITTYLGSLREYLATVPENDEDLLGESVVKESEEIVASQDRAEQYGVKDTELYDALGVDPDASPEAIQRRYYRKMRLYCRRRAGGPAAAAGDSKESRERLEKVTRAYLVLTNPKLRERYDQVGTEGMFPESKKKTINPLYLFAVLYGSEKFEDYTGRLAAASAAAVRRERSGGTISAAAIQELQNRRVARLAIQLAARLGKWVAGDTQRAQGDWELEALLLSDSCYGSELLHVVGRVYSASACLFLGSWESGIGWPSLSNWAHRQNLLLQRQVAETVHKMETFAGDVRQLSVEQEVQSSELNRAVTAEQRDEISEELYERIGETVLDMLWEQTAADVTLTLHEAAQHVLHDQDCTNDTRKKRADALEALGEIFQNAAGTYSSDTEIEEEQARHERVAFFAVLDNIRRSELSARQSPRKGFSNGTTHEVI
jgi:hypothetical protein